MGKLRMYLPPYAPDYSGVCSALFELSGIVVIHDAGGCTGNYTGYDEPRWYGSESAVFCSGLREMDAVLGLDNELMEKIKIVCNERKSPTNFIAILGSPVPMLIGSDMKGIASELEKQIHIPCFGLDTNGFHIYHKGIAMAEKAIAERFVKQPKTKKERGINILGMTPIDFSLNENSEDLKKLLLKWGYDIISCFSMGASLKNIAEAAQAKINLVVSQGGMQLAQWMEKKYHIPYVAGIAMGKHGEICLQKTLEKALEHQKSYIIGKYEYKKDTFEKNTASNFDLPKRILFLGEQVQGISWRAAYREKHEHDYIQIGCIFGRDDELAEYGDIPLFDESDVIKLFLSEKYDVVIADPLFEELIPNEKREHTKFVKFPHIAVSSKIYWDSVPRFIEEKFESYK